MAILSFDLGKFNSVACIFSTGGPHGQPEHRFQSLPTTPRDIHDLLVEAQPQRVVFETWAPAPAPPDQARCSE